MDENLVYSWYEQYKNGIFRYILSMTHDPHLAEDVLQDTFVQLLISNVHLAAGKEQAWLYKVARNRCLDILKKDRKQNELPPDVPAEPDWNRTFIEMISPLPKREQEIISLKFIGGFSHKEIAHITGTTVAASKKRYERAIKKLRAEMEVSS
ncbi:MAG TPA: RNA polymerase sigma factor [Candidatus Mediterraneibacter faecavium]|uniref:RNA polymerase sigma factor n=1 Tax=Candidatus Mediterraneibacter faecavium TaxID=2838668 RepID=A0A9D2QAM5_9FIRM|nr:RNA polymerase sigma factor [Candidatus Mediterraneibacter faecavium]